MRRFFLAVAQRRTFVALILLGFGLAKAGTAAAYVARPLDPNLDHRLRQAVTVRGERVYIGELLEALQRSTRVRLAPGDQPDGSADFVITVHVTRKPLWQVLDALCSLVSYREAPWVWSRERAGGELGYRLRRPLKAQQFAARYESEVQTAFEEHADRMLRAALHPEERARLAASDDIIGGLNEGSTVWAGLRLFAEAVPENERLDILRGKGVPRIPLSSLSPAARSFVAARWDQAGRKGVFGANVGADGPAWVRPYVLRSGPKVAPSLMIEIEGLGANAYLGGTPLETRVRTDLRERWLTDGDSRSDPAEARTLPREAPADDLAPAQKRKALAAARLRQLADAASISFLAVLPADQRYDAGPPAGMTLGAYLERIGESGLGLHHKWRTGVLLLCYPESFKSSERALNPSWALVQHVRAAERQTEGRLSLETIADLISRLPDDALELLSPEYPALRAAREWRGLFEIKHRSGRLWAALTQSGGVPLEALYAAVPQSLGAQVQALTSGAVRGRLVEEERGADTERTHVIVLQGLARDGSVVRSRGFSLRPREAHPLSVSTSDAN